MDLPTCKRLVFKCPGCECSHYVNVALKNGTQGPLWEWNGSMERPTIIPSILVHYPAPAPPDRPATCHSFVREGRIEYCPDSSHALAGKAVDLPEWENA